MNKPDAGFVTDRVLDARGLMCPLPLLKARLALQGLHAGQTLKVVTTDQVSMRDFPAFARISGHLLLFSREVAGTYVHILRKK